MAGFRTIEGELRRLPESSDWGVDPGSGSRVIRLTSGPGMAHNIYCEQPYGSPDGKRALIFRTHDLLSPHRQLLIAEVCSRARHVTQVEPDVPSESIAHTSWGEWAYYTMHDGSLRRVSLMSLERQEVLPPGTFSGPEHAGICSMTPDGRRLIGNDYDGPALRTYALDIETGERRVIVEGPQNKNPHAQIELGSGRRCLYQLSQLSALGGVPVFARSLDGGQPEQLPFGGEWSAESTGHMAWIAGTGRVACAVNWLRAEKRHDPRHAEGNMLTAAPSDEGPTVFPAPEHGFYHVSISRCGRYFVSDDFMDFRADAFGGRFPGPLRIVVGNFQTGKHATLIRDCQNYGIAGCSRFEPDPYFTADNRFVIYNASPFGVMQVFAAEVPEPFLSGLD